MKIKFLGHASILIQENKVKMLVDPFLSQNPQYKEDKEDTSNITHIFITHAHGDHIGDAMEIASKNDSLIISNAEICSILYRKNKELKYHPMHIGGRFTFPFGTVKMTPALHGSGYTDENGFIQDGGNPGGLTMDMQLLEREKIDVAFLPIGGNYTMDIDDAVEAARFIQSKTVIPMHYNTFGPIKANPVEFKDKLLGHHVVILEPGESIDI